VALSASYIVNLAVQPPTATIELDGVQTGANSLAVRFSLDGRRHVIRATATGYRPYTSDFTDAPPPPTITLVQERGSVGTSRPAAATAAPVGREPSLARSTATSPPAADQEQSTARSTATNPPAADQEPSAALSVATSPVSAPLRPSPQRTPTSPPAVNGAPILQQE